ncbi:MAG: ABC transporter permease [Sphingopyxis sp.]
MSPYAFKLAVRHLLSHRGQTALLVTGVALGVSVFVFMSALIGGLAELLTARTIGSIPHIVLEAPERGPLPIAAGDAVQRVRQKDLGRRDQIPVWEPLIAVIEGTGKVTAVSPQITGGAFIERGQAVAPVGVVGVTPDKLSAIADIAGAVVSGTADLPPDGILIGSRLARHLDLRAGQVIRIASDRGRSRSLRVQGIFTLGIGSADRQAVYMNFTAARALFDLPTGVTRIEVKVNPATDADAIAARLRRSTGLDAIPWTSENSQLFEGLDAQARTGLIIKSFALVTIIVGIASAMLLSIARRQAEIGIMRAMGATKRLVVSIYVIEGTLLGLVGGVVGASIAWLALLPFPPVSEIESGALPIDRNQGDFLLAILLTSLAAMLASLLPARRAARIDPVEAIGA